MFTFLTNSIDETKDEFLNHIGDWKPLIPDERRAVSDESAVDEETNSAIQRGKVSLQGRRRFIEIL